MLKYKSTKAATLCNREDNIPWVDISLQVNFQKPENWMMRQKQWHSQCQQLPALYQHIAGRIQLGLGQIQARTCWRCWT